MKKERNKGSGGTRPGAGRKPNPMSKKSIAFRFQKSTIERLKTIKNYNSFAEKAIVEKLEKEE
jgi:hypothetical protein